MNRILIVSNRLPVSVVKSEQGITVNPSVGGLATGMKSIYKEMDSTWIGWPGIDRKSISDQEEKEINKRLEEEKCQAIYIDEADMDLYYSGFSNKTIWPLFHYFPQYTVYNTAYWEAYRKVNRIFADTIASLIQKEDFVWVHDYHLLLLPRMIKEQYPDTTIGFFNHIPFPSYEIFRQLPWRMELLQGMLGADLVGFHTYDYQRHFNSCVRRLFGYDYEMNLFNTGTRIIKTDSYSMGIDYDKFRKKAEKIQEGNQEEHPELKKDIEDFFKAAPDRKLILSIDRMDYSKGIPNRLKAFKIFLDKYPEYHGKISLVMLTVPSRSSVSQYQLLKKEVDELVGKINGKYGNLNWSPVWYFYRSLAFENLVVLYRYANIALITPLRDGMNLVAKEYLASRLDGTGVLILSEMAGSAKEMNEAVIINPNNLEEIAGAIRYAIELPEEKQIKRNRYIQRRLKRNTVEKWAADFVQGMKEIRNVQEQYISKKLSAEVISQMKNKFRHAENKILLLDYHGTLITQNEEKEYPSPDPDLYKLLDQLTEPDNTEVVLMSRCDKQLMDKWFGHYPFTLIAEHGLWKRIKNEEWDQTTRQIPFNWKPALIPVMETYVDRTPGSYIEEMNNVLSWHFEKADPDHGKLRARDLKEELSNRILNMELQILEGHKVIEVKPSAMSKGLAAMKSLDNQRYEFILAAGDDWTDETLFDMLPDAFTVKVGIKKTQAAYYCDSFQEIRSLLKTILSS